jgi:hypothetical protein
MAHLPHTVRVDSGKYTFVREALSIKILRHGEPWHEQREAFNALASIMYELDAARVVVEAARRLIEQATACGAAVPPGLVRALERHSSLVSDSEVPSEWCGPSLHAEPF